MSKKSGFQIVTLILATSLIVSCSKNDPIPHPKPEPGPYENGFFILNEGWFGNEAGSVNFYEYGSDSLIKNVYAKENNGEGPSKEGSTLENGLIYNGRLYLISKAGGDIVVADANTLKKIGVIQMENSDFRSIVPVAPDFAAVSTNKGILPINLGSLKVDPTPIAGDGPVKDLLLSDGKLYASAHKGVDIYIINNMENGEVMKHYDGPTEGYVVTPDKLVYGAGKQLLIAIDPAKMDTTQIHLVAPINQNDFAYAKSSIVASVKENTVYYVAASSDFKPREIYRYEKGKPNSIQKPFITLPDGEQFYQTGIGYDWVNDQIITISITGYSDTDKNFLHFYDAKTGTLKKTIEYGHPYFPAMMVFKSRNFVLD